MEGVPRIPMLSVEAKTCAASVTFRPHLRKYIASHYEESPDKYEQAIDEFEKLRERACTGGDTVESAESLSRYLGQLELVKRRFPSEVLSQEEFVWLDKFGDGGSPVRTNEIGVEEAALVHNIGAAHSSLGAREPRVTPESGKAACAHFTKALGAFLRLRDYPAYSLDLESSLSSWYATLMRAQAQECVLEKSMVDGRKAAVVARVSAAIAALYRTSGRLLESDDLADIVGSTKARGWRKFSSMKEAFYSSLSAFFKGQEADEAQQFGLRLAWFARAQAKLDAATKDAHKDTPAIMETLSFAQDVVAGRLANAQKENDFVYHEKVPADAELAEVEGVTLVKAGPMELVDPKAPDLFKALLPIHVHAAGSLYSEEKAAFMRSVMGKVEAKDAELGRFMSALDLSDLRLEEEEGEERLPQELIQANARLSAEAEPLKAVFQALKRLEGCYSEASAVMGRVDEALGEASQGAKAADAAELDGLRRALGRFQDKADAARHSNSQLLAAAHFHEANIGVLALPFQQLLQHLPPSPAQGSSSGSEAAQMQRLAGKVEEMRTQRAMLVDQLRAHLHADDIAAKLLALPEDAEPNALFSAELGKHSELVSILDANMGAQANILGAIVEANAGCAARRRESASRSAAREAKVSELLSAAALRADVADKAELGRLFYAKLLQGLGDLEERVHAVLARKAKPAPPPPPPPPQPSPRAEEPTQPKPERPKAKVGDYMEFFRSKAGGGLPPSPRELQPQAPLPTQPPLPPAPQLQLPPHPQSYAPTSHSPATVPYAVVSSPMPPPPPQFQAAPHSPQSYAPPSIHSPASYAVTSAPMAPPIQSQPPQQPPYSAHQNPAMPPAPVYRPSTAPQTSMGYTQPPMPTPAPMPLPPPSQYRPPPPTSQYSGAPLPAASSSMQQLPQMYAPPPVSQAQMPEPRPAFYGAPGSQFLHHAPGSASGGFASAPTGSTYSAPPRVSTLPSSAYYQPSVSTHYAPQPTVSTQYAPQPAVSAHFAPQPTISSNYAPQAPVSSHFVPQPPVSSHYAPQPPPTSYLPRLPSGPPPRPVGPGYGQPQPMPTSSVAQPWTQQQPSASQMNSFYKPIPGAPLPSSPQRQQTPSQPPPVQSVPQPQVVAPPARRPIVNAMDAPNEELGGMAAPLQPRHLPGPKEDPVPATVVSQESRPPTTAEELSEIRIDPRPAPPPPIELKPTLKQSDQYSCIENLDRETAILAPPKPPQPPQPEPEPVKVEEEAGGIDWTTPPPPLETPPLDPSPPTPPKPQTAPTSPSPVPAPHPHKTGRMGVADVTDPNKFNLGSPGPPKTKKEEFFKPREPRVSQPNDPFAHIDPFKTFK